MDIKVLRKSKGIFVKQNTVEINFKKFNWKRGSRKIPMIVAYANQGDFIPVSLNLLHTGSRIPSTLLSRWINANCSEKLLTLKDRCNTVERIKDGVNKGWWFTNLEDSVYGLHRISIKESLHDKTVEFCVVNIDDSIGMNSVKNILTNLGISLSCEFDTVSSKMTSITLKFGGD